MPQQKKQETGTGAIAGGGALSAFGVANAPILRHGTKDPSKMVGASPKLQGKRYQAELHGAMKAGKVKTDSPVQVLRTPSGRHINAGGTHRHIARQAMGKPSNYEIKDISHEVHVSPAQKFGANRQLRSLKRGSKAAEAGKKVRPVNENMRHINETLADAADVNDAKLWAHPSAMKPMAAAGRKAGFASAGILTGAGALLTHSGLSQRKEAKKKGIIKSASMSAFGVEHGYDEISKEQNKPRNMRREGYGFASRKGRRNVLREAGRNRGYVLPTSPHRKENWKTLGRNVAGGAGGGAAVGAVLGSVVRQPALGALHGADIGALGGALKGSIDVNNRGLNRAFDSGIKRGDIRKPRKGERVKGLSPKVVNAKNEWK